MGGDAADLIPGIEDPRASDAVRPCAVWLERCLVYVAGEHGVGLVGLDPVPKIRVTVFTPPGPRRGRADGRPVVYPEPSSKAPAMVGSQLRSDTFASQGSVPPRADGDEGVAKLERVTVGRDTQASHLRQPQGRLLALRIGAREVVGCLSSAQLE